jgi:hypothetical protein
MNYNYYFFYTLIIISYIFYFAFIIHFIQLKSYSTYHNYLQIIVQIYISLYLLIRFRPFHKIKFTNLDKAIIFNAGILLLTTSILNYYITSIKKILNIQ